MKIAVFGGSFNPLHVGHTMLADTVVKELGYDLVVFVPTFLPPHKIINSKISPEQRLEMIKLFCDSEGNEHFTYDAFEMEQGGISYTCNTLEYLTEKYRNQLDGKLGFIMGDEVAAEFDKWYKPERVSELADLIITHRYPDIDALENYLYKAKEKQSDCKIITVEENAQNEKNVKNNPKGCYKGDFSTSFDEKSFKYPFVYLKNPVLPVSSTEIRSRVQKKRSYKYLVPKVVYEYIEKYGLYK